MSDPITWYLQSRTIDDDQSILEAIDAKILTHNQDPSGHGQAGEAVEEHRSDEDIDHPAYSIYNITQNPATRAIKAFVGEAGVGDFIGIQQAIDYVELHGGGRVFIKNGTYYPLTDIVLPNNVYLEGESMDETIIDFNGLTKKVLVQGAADTSPTGTITVTNGSKEIVGDGTLFTTEAATGDYIRVNDSWYKIITITDNTHLDLADKYEGITQAALAFDFMTPRMNVKLEEFSVKNSAGNGGVKALYIKDCQFNNIRSFSGTSTGLYFGWCADCSFENVYSLQNTGTGILIDNCQSTNFLGISSLSNGQFGIQVQGADTNGILVFGANASHNDWEGLRIIAGNRNSYIACSAVGNDDDGIALIVANYCNVIGCYSEKNAGHGIEVANGGARCKITNNTCNDNGDDGIFIGANEHKHIVMGNTALGNANEQIDNDSGDSDVSHNIVT